MFIHGFICDQILYGLFDMAELLFQQLTQLFFSFLWRHGNNYLCSSISLSFNMASTQQHNKFRSKNHEQIYSIPVKHITNQNMSVSDYIAVVTQSSKNVTVCQMPKGKKLLGQSGRTRKNIDLETMHIYRQKVAKWLFKLMTDIHMRGNRQRVKSIYSTLTTLPKKLHHIAAIFREMNCPISPSKPTTED